MGIRGSIIEGRIRGKKREDVQKQSALIFTQTIKHKLNSEN